VSCRPRVVVAEAATQIGEHRPRADDPEEGEKATDVFTGGATATARKAAQNATAEQEAMPPWRV
jgi:hypothetical protein